MPGKSQHSDDRAPGWVIVAAAFHRHGGMDAANAALASYLAARGHRVHLVGHQIDDEIRSNDSITFHRVVRPLDSDFLGLGLLARTGRVVARRALAANPQARVVVNGGNCNFPDINWVHAVHRAWPVSDEGAPVSFRIKHQIDKEIARRTERSALRSARVILANSNRTREHLINHLGIPAGCVHTVYLGSEPHWKTVNAETRIAARSSLRIPASRPAIAFVGALGHDRNKGFDTLWHAWQRLCARREWDADLIVAGGGRAVDSWRRRIAAAGLADRVRLIGHTEVIAGVLAAADLLVSPVRYEAYGLAVHEALCCGVPAMVTATAGVAERYPASLREWLIADPENVESLVERLLEWRKSPETWKERVQPLARQLRARTWDDMAAEVVEIAEAAPPSADVACS